MKLFFSLFVLATFCYGQKFAVIGDYGDGSTNEAAVSDMIDSWNVDFIITLGDNNYGADFAATVDDNIGRDYNQWISPYSGVYPPGGSSDGINKFFPSPGNHDNNQTLDIADLQPYLDFFTLPGNERYYDFVKGKIHFFSMNSIVAEPDGYQYPSVQATWLENKLTECVTTHDHWRLVYFHHTPYSSQQSATWSDWPYAEFGAQVVLAGHSHTYERIFRNGIVYFVNGLGGASIYPCGSLTQGSQGCYDDTYGAQLVTVVDDVTLLFEFYNIDGTLIDSYILGDNPIPVELVYFRGTLANNDVVLEWESVSEIDNSGWEIERSFKKNNNYQTIDFVASLGNSTSSQYYSYTDVLSSYGKYFYRLKQIDIDGNFFYSDAIIVHYKRTTNEDTTPPRVIQANLVDEWTVNVEFSETVVAADNVNNYDIAGPQTITINLADYSDPIATIHTSEHIQGDYTVTVSNVTDNAGNVIDPNNNSANYSLGGAPAVVMSYFTATLTGNEVILDWKTLSENGNLGWDVEESSKNTSNFTKIEPFVDGAGTSNTPIIYSFNTNLSKYGKYYYRLKQYSTVGSFTYSDNVLVDYKRTRNAALSSYPTPFNPQTTITVNIDKMQDVKINVYNMLGQHIKTLFDGTAEAGEMRFTFDGQRLSSGTYVVVMQTESSIINHKILLLK
jgi:predicted phosphodiesterase